LQLEWFFFSYDASRPLPQKTGVNGTVPLSTIINNGLWIKRRREINLRNDKGTFVLQAVGYTPSPSVFESLEDVGKDEPALSGQKVMLSPAGRPVRNVSSPKKYGNNGRIRLASNEPEEGDVPTKKRKRLSMDEEPPAPTPVKDSRKGIFCSKFFSSKPVSSTIAKDREIATRTSVESLIRINRSRIACFPLYGEDFVRSLTLYEPKCNDELISKMWLNSTGARVSDTYSVGLDWRRTHCLGTEAARLLSRFHLFVPPVITERHHRQSRISPIWSTKEVQVARKRFASLSPLQFFLQLPEARLIEYDCGKLQTLGRLLSKLRSGGHRVLLFTQMTRMLDVLEAFLNCYGYTYLRLDGSTKVEQRQALTERFNNSTRYFCFILSTRSGGVGINLTGADTVVFYDR